jgi:hypothetical protein
MKASRFGKTDTVALLVDREATIEATDKVRLPQHSTVFHLMSS